jgi:hypothetical protein
MEILGEAKSQLPPHVQCCLLGIDIDSSLIDLAKEKFRDDPVQFQHLDFMDVSATKEFMQNYYSTLSTRYAGQFAGFNVVCLFSVTMWIHLNHGDDGLLSFLERSAELLRPEGSLVVEPQPWKCYKSADKRCRKLGITRPLHFSQLAVRDIEKDMVDVVMGTRTNATTEINASEITATTDPVAPTEAPEDPGAELQAKKTNKAGKKRRGGAQNPTTTTAPLRDISHSMNMHSYWDLGKEGWGRSIFIFHRSKQLQTRMAPAIEVAAGAGAGAGAVEGVGDVDEDEQEGKPVEGAVDGDDGAAECKKARM